jgi:hypothetical protein
LPGQLQGPAAAGAGGPDSGAGAGGFFTAGAWRGAGRACGFTSALAAGGGVACRGITLGVGWIGSAGFAFAACAGAGVLACTAGTGTGTLRVAAGSFLPSPITTSAITAIAAAVTAPAAA